MVNVDEFNQENQEIIDLREVLTVLVDNADLRQNPVFCDLLERFRGKVQAHLDHEDRSVYADLLNHQDRSVNEVAEHFMQNTHELKRIFSRYIKHWCHGHSPVGGAEGDVEDFLRETREIFHLVDERITLEKNKLFPILAGS